MTEINFPHDKGYKHLLSSRKIFLELLENFVDLGLVKQNAPESLLRMDRTFILRDFQEREADLVYRLKLQDQEIIFYILIELQSTVDFHMPARLLVYMVEIWRDFLRGITDESYTHKDFRLPAIVPIVLYNGASPWTACLSFKEYLSGAELAGKYVLDFQYFLIDINRMDKETLRNMANVIGSVFLLDQNSSQEETIRRLLGLRGVFKKWTRDDFNTFIHWLKEIFTIGLSDNHKGEVSKILTEVSLEEADAMISNLVETLRKMEENIGNARIEEVAKKMVAEGFSEEMIIKITGLSVDAVRALKTGKNLIFQR